MLAMHVEVVDPWSLTTAADVAAAFAAGRQADFWIEVGERNFRAMESCQILVAILDGEPPDNGTVAEVAWAARAGLRVIGYRNDLRQSGEDGVPVNLMIPAAIKRSGGVWVTNLRELEAAVVEALEGTAPSVD